MLELLELDIKSLHLELGSTAFLKARDVLGPKERLLGSTNHLFRRFGSSLILQIQDFKFAAPYALKTMRKNFVAFQFTKTGSYYRNIADKTDYVGSTTVQITNFPEATSYVSFENKCLSGIAMFVEREYLIDVMGLKVDNLRDPYRSIFSSELGSSRSLQLPLPPHIWGTIDDISSCTFDEPLRGVYLNSKATELICHVIAHINLSKAPQSTLGLPEAFLQRQKLAIASEIYRRELRTPPSIADLAARVGLNRNQLIAGFSELHGLTPHKYSIKIRMEWARSQITKRCLALTDIACAAGYENYSAFSRAYHSYFGEKPSAADCGSPAA